jgi:hypothetical protein
MLTYQQVREEQGVEFLGLLREDAGEQIPDECQDIIIL